jgi:hypothetical protein
MSIDTNIEKLFSFADNAMREATNVANRISSFIPAIPSGQLDFTLEKPVLPTPEALGNSDQTLQFLKARVDELTDQFFPEISACLRYTPEEWLCGIITGQKPFGLSREVFDTIWHEGRDREYRSRNATAMQIRSEFSQRGFQVPPGAMFQAQLQAEQRAADAIGDVNRTQTVRSAEIKLDLLKFAEEQAINLKTAIFQATANYYRVLMDLPSKDIEASRLQVAAYSSLNDAMSQIYRVQLGFEELRLQAENLRVNGTLDSARLAIAASTDGSRNGALGQTVRAYADAGAAAAGNASTLNANIVSG